MAVNRRADVRVWRSSIHPRVPDFLFLQRKLAAGTFTRRRADTKSLTAIGREAFCNDDGYFRTFFSTSAIPSAMSLAMTDASPSFFAAASPASPCR